MTYTLTVPESMVFERDGQWYWIGSDGNEHKAGSEDDARAAVRVDQISDILEC